MTKLVNATFHVGSLYHTGGEADNVQMATMKDQILVSKKLSQIYGTQWNMVGEQQVLYPLKNVNQVNYDRKSVGLIPLSEEVIKSALTGY